MSTTINDIMAELEKAGIEPGDIDDHLINSLVEYRCTGRCAPVNYSSALFIPILSTLLEKVSKRP